MVVGGGRGGARRGETNRTISQLIPFAVFSVGDLECEQLYQGKRMIGGIGDVWFSIYSQT